MSAKDTISNQDILVFTANPSPRSQATSEGFREQGRSWIGGLQIWEVAVNPVPPESWSLLGLTSIIAYVYSVVALILGRAIKLDGAQFTYIARYTTPVKNFFLYPDVVVGFGKDSNNETLVGKLQSLGFRKESAGRRIYYRGPTTQLYMF
jgi:hypothetical protein